MADAAALPFRPSSIDVLICQFGLMFVPDKETAFDEARRVLKPGGSIAFNIWDSPEHNSFGRLSHETITGFFATDPPTVYQMPFGFADSTAWRRRLEAHGFGQINLRSERLDEVKARHRNVAEDDAHACRHGGRHQHRGERTSAAYYLASLNEKVAKDLHFLIAYNVSSGSQRLIPYNAVAGTLAVLWDASCSFSQAVLAMVALHNQADLVRHE